MSRTSKAIVVTEPKETVVNTIAVNEVKKLIDEQVEKPKQELIGYTRVEMDDVDHTMRMEFNFKNSDERNKVLKANLIILTYANCFIMTPLSQTGKARTVGNLVNDSSGNSHIGKLSFEVTEGNPGSLMVKTNVEWDFSSYPEGSPIAYLFILSF